MADLRILYDRHSQDDYGPLIAELKKLGAVHRQQSVWALETSLTPQRLGAHLKRLLDPGDKLEVISVAGSYRYPPASLGDLLGRALQN